MATEPRAGPRSKSRSAAWLNHSHREMNSSWEQLIARAQMRQSNLHLWPSQPHGSDDRLPEEHTKRRNHNNPKDKAPRVADICLVVVGGQPVGIAHAKLLGRPPASQPHQTLIKVFLNLSFSCRRRKAPSAKPRDAQFVAAERGRSRSAADQVPGDDSHRPYWYGL